MKAWIVGDSFGVPNITTTWFDQANDDFYEGLLPGNEACKGNEWTKQVVEALGYEYSIPTNFSRRGCSNEAILHKIDWLLNNDNMFDKSSDMLVIIPTVSNRFMYKDLKDVKQFRFNDIEKIHMATCGSIKVHIPVIDEYNTLHRDHDYEEYKMLSAYDKLLSHLKLHNIKHFFSPGMWTCIREEEWQPRGLALEFLQGFTPTNIDLDFPAYDIGIQADKAYAEGIMKRELSKSEDHWIYTHFAVADLYTNHMSHVGNNAYAKAVLEYVNERS